MEKREICKECCHSNFIEIICDTCGNQVDTKNLTASCLLFFSGRMDFCSTKCLKEFIDGEYAKERGQV